MGYHGYLWQSGWVAIRVFLHHLSLHEQLMLDFGRERSKLLRVDIKRGNLLEVGGVHSWAGALYWIPVGREERGEINSKHTLMPRSILCSERTPLNFPSVPHTHSQLSFKLPLENKTL